MIRRTHLLLALASTCIASGCRTAAPRQTEYMASIPGLELSVNQLRFLVLDYHDYFSSRTATAARDMYGEQSERQHRVNSLAWRNNTVSAAQEFAFQSDPLVGLVQLMVLSARMRDYFEGPAAEELFGPSHVHALQAARDLDRRGKELARRVSSAEDLEVRLMRLDSAAAADPLVDLAFLEGTAFAAPETFVTESAGGLQTLGSLEQTTRDLSERINVYYRYLPRQLRWEIELLVEEAYVEFGEGALEDVDEIATALTGLDRRVAMITDSLVDEAALLGEEVLLRERATILDDVDRQRLATIAALQAELELALADVDRQRNETFATLDELIARARADAVADVDVVVDDAIRRAGLLALGLGAALFVGLALLVLLYNRTRPEARSV